MFGSQGAFYYSHVVGLRRAGGLEDAALDGESVIAEDSGWGWRTFRVAPLIAQIYEASGLTSASAEMETVAGKVAAAWSIDKMVTSSLNGCSVKVSVTVPPGSVCAVIAVPFSVDKICGGNSSSSNGAVTVVTEGNTTVWDGKGFKPVAGLVSGTKRTYCASAGSSVDVVEFVALAGAYELVATLVQAEPWG
jgi:hypothetical protein